MNGRGKVEPDHSLALSIVVCTYDRPGLLADCLSDLGRQTLDRSRYEVIVVDNRPAEATRQVAERFTPSGNVRYCPEPREGLSHARNHGWKEARGWYVAYIDDDCRVPKHWAERAIRVAHALQPAAFGGPYYALYNTPKPAWYLDRYASHVQGEQPRPLKDSEFLDGTNVVFRRSVLQRLGGFDPKLGMSGEKCGYGEETQLLRRIRTSMPEELIHYEPELYVHHLVLREKMAIRWSIRQHFTSGRYSHRVFGSDAPPTAGRARLLARAVSTSAAVVWETLRGSVMRDRSRYPYLQNYLHERALLRLQTLGGIFEQYCRRPRFFGVAPVQQETG